MLHYERRSDVLRGGGKFDLILAGLVGKEVTNVIDLQILIAGASLSRGNTPDCTCRERFLCI